MSVYDDKMNQEMLKVVCDLNRLIAEAVKVTGVTILNALTNKSMKDKLDIHGHFNNYDVLSVTGLTMDEAKALLREKKKIIANGFYDRGGHYILAIKRSDFDKISELEKEIADGTLDVDDFLEEYRKNKSEQEHGHSSDGERPNGMPDPIDVPFEEVPEDAPELTEEDFEQGGDFEVNFNPEEVVQNIENEKTNKIEREIAAEEAIDHNNDFASGERNESDTPEFADILNTEEDIEEPEITPELPPVHEEDIKENASKTPNIDVENESIISDESFETVEDISHTEENTEVSEIATVSGKNTEKTFIEDQNIDISKEHISETTEEFSREDSDNDPSIQEEQTESAVHEKEDDSFEGTSDDTNNVAPKVSEKVNSIDAEELHSTSTDNEPEHLYSEMSVDEFSDDFSSENHREGTERAEDLFGGDSRNEYAFSEEHEKDSEEQYAKSDKASPEEHNVEESNKTYSVEQSPERQDAPEYKSRNKETIDRSVSSENRIINHSDENNFYRNDNDAVLSVESTINTSSVGTNNFGQRIHQAGQKTDKAEQSYSAVQKAETKKQNDNYNKVLDLRQDRYASPKQQTTHADTLKERDRREREEAIQKQIDRRERRENATVVKVGTGASLFSSYGDVKDAEQLHAADKDNRVVFSDHREVKTNSKEEISGFKMLQINGSHKNTPNYSERQQNHYTLSSYGDAKDAEQLHAADKNRGLILSDHREAKTDFKEGNPSSKRHQFQKQIDRKEHRENATPIESGAGISLYSSYGDTKGAEQLHAADKDNRIVFSDHREMRFEAKSEIFSSKMLQDEKSSNKGTLAYKEQTNNSYKLPSSPLNSMESKTNVQFNKLTLVNRYTGNVATDMVKSVGTVFVGSIEEGHRESMQGQGKAQMSGISTYINNIGYSNLASVKRDALIRKTQRELNSGTGAYGQLNQLLKTKGFAGIDFSSRKQAGTSMEDIYKMLQRSGMASNRSGVWDLTKFDRLYRRARKGNDYSEIARALGISSISKAEMKLIGEQIHQIVRRDRIGRKSTEGAVSTGKTLRSMIAHKLGQDSQVLAGYMNIKQTVQTVRSTAKAAWLMAVTSGRVIGKLDKWAGRLIGFGANTRLLRDTAFGKGYRKIDSGAKKIGCKIDDLKNHHREKKDKKDSKKEKKKTNEKKKREDRQKARRNARQARFASLAGKWNHFAPGFLRTNSFIGRTVGSVGKAVARTTKILGNVFKSVFSLIGAVSLAKAYIKKTLIYVLGGSFLIMGAAVVVISAPIDFILGFETTDDEDSTGDPIMDKTMHSLQEMETKWTDSLLNDTEGVNLTDYNLKYGSSYKTAAEYMPASGAPRIFWGQHNVKWNDLSGFTANPFGNFDLENDNTASFMDNINGGVELIYKTKDGSARTSNIKEIICMADIYTMFSTEAEDTHDDGQAVDGNESAKTKQSGATFAASNKKINGDIKSWASNSMIAYAQDLFNMSHQEIIDLQYVILPTKVTKDSFDPDTAIVDGENNTSVKVTQCPDYDLGGCQIYDNFYYDKNGIAVKDKDGNLHTAGGVYPLRKNNMEFDEDESGNIINTEYCFADSVAGFGNIYNSDNAACWKIELQDSKSDEIEDYSEPSESGISDAVKSLTGDKEYVTGFSWSDAGYFILTTEIVGETRTHTNPEWVIDVPGHPEIGHIALNPYQATDVESRTYHVTHKCAGDHHGRYCGGHLKAKITGVIYGFTDAEVGAEEAGVTIAGKVEDGAFVHKDSNKFVVNDSNIFKTAQDIFDIDAACTHPNEREDWEGWTEENIELTLLKYNMDWEDLYGFDLSTTLGGQALTSADTQEIMKQIRENYPGLSEERLSVVERGLNYVGKIGYSQAHHNCPLEGPCLINKNGPCYLSDCSGFTSNLWINELGGIFTTDGFRAMLNGKFDSSKNLPGDIIVHYDPNGNHALLYIGEFEYDGVYQTWSIDCSTVKGVGNVFLRHRDYYDSCSYISPAP